MASSRTLTVRSSPSFLSQAPVLDFLAPRLFQQHPRRHISEIPLRPSSAPTNKSQEASITKCNDLAPSRPLSAAQRSYLDRAMRVNQAGELAATLIYSSQTPVVTRTDPHLRPLMQHFYDQEAGHFATFNALLAKHRIRPTALTPLWRVAATALGWGTAVISREAAMACTEAVETEIGEHYNGQVRELLAWIREAEAKGEEVGGEVRELVEKIRVIRDEELEHLDESVGEGAHEAQAYPVLSAVIRGGCRSAIWLSERI